MMTMVMETMGMMEMIKTMEMMMEHGGILVKTTMMVTIKTTVMTKMIKTTIMKTTVMIKTTMMMNTYN